MFKTPDNRDSYPRYTYEDGVYTEHIEEGDKIVKYVTKDGVKRKVSEYPRRNLKDLSMLDEF